MGQKNILNITVEESWYFYPLPYLKIHESTLSKATYGLNLLYKNFRGRNETISTILTLGYDPLNALTYINPALNDEKDIFLVLLLINSDVSNKSILAEEVVGKEFTNTMFLSEVSLGKRINQYNTASVLLGFNYIKVPLDGISGLSASGKGIDRTPVIGVKYIYDTRNLIQFPENGTYILAEYKHFGLGLNNISYNKINLDFRNYRKISDRLTLKLRTDYTNMFGKLIPYYDRAFLGYKEIVRGHLQDKRSGHNRIILSTVLSYHLLKELNYSFDLPLIPTKLTSGRLALHLNLFVDTGTTYVGSQDLAVKNFDTGYGVGLNILFIPYNALRFEYAFNEQGKGEFLFGIGFSF